MTFGDVLAFVSLIFTIAGALIATILLAILLFPATIRRCQETAIQQPGRCFARGIGISVVAGLLAALLGQSHAGPVRIIGGALLTGLGILVVIGGGGIVRLLGDRMQQMGTQMTPFAALTRGAILYVLAGFLPIFGWFLVMPATTMVAIGSAWSGIRNRPGGARTTAPSANGIGYSPAPASTAPDGFAVASTLVNGVGAESSPLNGGAPGSAGSVQGGLSQENQG